MERGSQVAKEGRRAKEHNEMNGTGTEKRCLLSARWERARGRGECREVRPAKV